jgi:hypothetical protein
MGKAGQLMRNLDVTMDFRNAGYSMRNHIHNKWVFAVEFYIGGRNVVGGRC